VGVETMVFFVQWRFSGGKVAEFIPGHKRRNESFSLKMLKIGRSCQTGR
jgi:hypothetical protein